VAFNDSHDSSVELVPDSLIDGLQMFGPEGAYSFEVFSWAKGADDLMIVIEEDLGGAEKELLEQDNATVTLSPLWDFTSAEERQRRIAGHEGIMKIAQSEEGHTMCYGTFWLRSKTSCDDMTIGKLARVQISCLDYTEEEFDRILDTLEIERYIKPIKVGSGQ